ncbi:MAG: hypothetical protein HY744_05315 [Deltaproteobacteria bacterium]|nr:hypothetical protein [Deltaproteobacteria bacterium]
MRWGVLTAVITTCWTASLLVPSCGGGDGGPGGQTGTSTSSGTGATTGGGAAGGAAGAGGSTASGGAGGGAGGGGSGAGGHGGSGGFSAACSACHGKGTDPAPPPDTDGGTDTSLPSVGAHQSHFLASTWHLQVACKECHIVPVKVEIDPNVPTHQDGKVDIDFGTIAGGDSKYDVDAHQCSAVHCHGGDLQPDIDGGTTVREPVWTKVDGSQSVCGEACHTLPPGGTHDGGAGQSCPMCHGAVIASFDPENPAKSLWSNPALHVNGVKEAPP